MVKTEERNIDFENIEKWDNASILKGMLISQEAAILAVEKASKSIENAISLAEETLKNDKSKIIYVGAGTSGRIGILDGVELIPTFGWPEERVDFCFSGVEVKKTSEGSEDDKELADKHFKNTKIKKGDVVLCLAASGSTIYTKTIIKKSKEVGAITISFSNNVKSSLSQYSDVSIFLNTGAEFLAGSTRLSAGTSQKIALNMFSTCLMIRLNRVYKGFMVEMKATNIKLKLRAEKILSSITNCNLQKARKVLEENNYNNKLSLMIINKFPKDKALKVLNECNGNLHKALDSSI